MNPDGWLSGLKRALAKRLGVLSRRPAGSNPAPSVAGTVAIIASPDLHKHHVRRIARDEEVRGRIVLAPFTNGTDHRRHLRVPESKGNEVCVGLHRRHIDLAEALIVAMPKNRRLGRVQKAAVEYARASGKPIRYAEVGGNVAHGDPEIVWKFDVAA